MRGRGVVGHSEFGAGDGGADVARCRLRADWRTVVGPVVAGWVAEVGSPPGDWFRPLVTEKVTGRIPVAFRIVYISYRSKPSG